MPYRDKNAVKVVEPKEEFYNLYSKEQIQDIINNLETHHEIPRQYNYFDSGAKRWEQYVERLATEDGPNTLTSTIKLLKINEEYIDNLLKSYNHVNVVDVGAGDAQPVKALLAHLLKLNKLGRYIALDISPSMLEITKKNIKAWFGGNVAFEGCPYDVNRDRFSKLLADTDTENTVNLILLLGGTLSNLRNPDNGYRMIHDSMGSDDILVHTTKLDTDSSRNYFDFNYEPGNTSLSPNHRLMFDLLNIDESLYEVEMGYDPAIQQRYIRVRLKVAITIRFNLEEGRREVSLHKNDTILLWRGIQHTVKSIQAQFDRNSFHLFHTSQTPSKDYILTISRVKRD